MNRYELDGRNIKDLQTLCTEFAKAVKAPENYFGKCFQSFDDCLFGGFGLEAPCEIVWKYAEQSKIAMNSQASEATESYEDIVEAIISVTDRAQFDHEVKLITE